MANKSLEEKIRIVGFWTFGFIFWYLVIAFFLKSDYPIYEHPFNKKDAYEIIKDALTLAAAFLAPVAAFVLFTDWRTEHREKTDEQDINKILDETEDIFSDLKIMHYRINVECAYTAERIEKIDKFFDELNVKLAKIRAHLNVLERRNPRLSNLLSYLDGLLISFASLSGSLGFDFHVHKIIQFPEREEFKALYLENESITEFVKRQRDINGYVKFTCDHENVCKLQKEMDELKKLVKEFFV